MVKPASLAEFGDAVRAMEVVRWRSVSGWGDQTPREEQNLGLGRWVGIVDHDVEDLVLEVRGGTLVCDLNEALAPLGQIVPYGAPKEPNPTLARRTVADALALDEPHAWGGGHGGWRDWVLGMSFLNAEGNVIKFGSRAVKSVAGFDFHKFIVGARGSFGIPLTVTLKTISVNALKPLTLEGTGPWDRIERVLPAEFGNVDYAYRDPAQSLVWNWGERVSSQPRGAHLMLLERAFAQLDPTRKFEPEAWI